MLFNTRHLRDAIAPLGGKTKTTLCGVDLSLMASPDADALHRRQVERRAGRHSESHVPAVEISNRLRAESWWGVNIGGNLGSQCLVALL